MFIYIINISIYLYIYLYYQYINIINYYLVIIYINIYIYIYIYFINHHPTLIPMFTQVYSSERYWWAGRRLARGRWRAKRPIWRRRWRACWTARSTLPDVRPTRPTSASVCVANRWPSCSTSTSAPPAASVPPSPRSSTAPLSRFTNSPSPSTWRCKFHWSTDSNIADRSDSDQIDG